MTIGHATENPAQLSSSPPRLLPTGIRRVAIICGVALALVAGGLWWLTSPDFPNDTQFSQVTLGMPEADVDALLGPPLRKFTIFGRAANGYFMEANGDNKDWLRTQGCDDYTHRWWETLQPRAEVRYLVITDPEVTVVSTKRISLPLPSAWQRLCSQARKLMRRIGF